MAGDAMDPLFQALRPRLVRLAYRMLGSVADAEDVVQEAYLRWQGTDRADLRVPEAFLRTVVTRLALDELKRARRRRETYVGPWLPEPMVEADDAPDMDDVTLPLMLALERLSPLERAAFLLHDVFGLSFEEVACTLARAPATCRKLASRARAHVRAARPRFPVERERGRAIAAAFFVASRTGDMAALRALLSEDVVAFADGGGAVPASPAPLVGLADVMARHEALARDFAAAPSRLLGSGMVDGLPGFLTEEAGGLLQVTALEVAEGRIAAIYVVRNPDKTRHLRAGWGAGGAGEEAKRP